MKDNTDKIEFSYFCRSEVGNTRTENQDNYLVINKGDWLLAAVCDGMGGARGGDIASELAIDTIKQELLDSSSSPTATKLTEILEKANRRIYDFGNKNTDKKGLGTTASILVLDAEGFRTAHIGDSRIYRRSNGKASPITTDHTWANELLLSGGTENQIPESSPMNHMLTRSLGVSTKLQVDVFESTEVSKSDSYLLCSDGIYNYLKGDELDKIWNSSDINNQQLVDKLFNHCLSREGADNLTAIYISQASDKNTIITPEIIFGRGLSDEAVSSSNVSVSDYFKIDQDYFDSSNGKTIDKEERNFTSFSSLLIGALFALVIGLFVSKIRPVHNYQHQSKSEINDSVNLSVFKDLPPIEAGYSNRFEIPLNQLYVYIREKNLEVLKPKEDLYAQNAAKKSITYFNDDSIDRPIVWENERKRIQIIRNNFDNADKLKLANSDLNELENETKIFSAKEKSLIREQIFDLDEKIRQLNIESKEEADLYKKELYKYKEDTNSDEASVSTLNSEVELKVKAYLQLKAQFLTSSESKLEILAARISTFDSSLEPLLRRHKLLKDTSKYYADLLDKVIQTDEVLLKLRQNQKELVILQQDLKNQIKDDLVKILDELSAYKAGLSYTQILLRLERDRINRSIGLVDAYAVISEKRREEMISRMLEERSSLFRKYTEANKYINEEQESKQTIKLFFDESREKLGKI